MILCLTADDYFSQCEGIVCVRYDPQMFTLKPIMILYSLIKKCCGEKKESETSEYKNLLNKKGECMFISLDLYTLHLTHTSHLATPFLCVVRVEYVGQCDV